jgi:hypothetical protein
MLTNITTSLYAQSFAQVMSTNGISNPTLWDIPWVSCQRTSCVRKCNRFHYFPKRKTPLKFKRAIPILRLSNKSAHVSFHYHVTIFAKPSSPITIQHIFGNLKIPPYLLHHVNINSIQFQPFTSWFFSSNSKQITQNFVLVLSSICILQTEWREKEFHKKQRKKQN